jgi:hypothetical protein
MIRWKRADGCLPATPAGPWCAAATSKRGRARDYQSGAGMLVILSSRAISPGASICPLHGACPRERRVDPRSADHRGLPDAVSPRPVSWATAFREGGLKRPPLPGLVGTASSVSSAPNAPTGRAACDLVDWVFAADVAPDSLAKWFREGVDRAGCRVAVWPPLRPPTSRQAR